MKIKRVGVIVQNYIQYESFKSAIDFMINKGIKVDILIPEKDEAENIWDNMYNSFYEYMQSMSYNILRKAPNYQYDILFSTHFIKAFEDVKKTLFVKYRYALPAKPWNSLTYRKNYLFDVILCYGQMDSQALTNFGKTFNVGNLKYYGFKKQLNKNKKKKIVYLPTYVEDTSSYKVFDELEKLCDKCDVYVKLHHGTNYLQSNKEVATKDKAKDYSFNICSSETSLLELLQDADLVISDNSGAVGDAVAARIPVLLIPNDKYRRYGEYITFQERLAQKKLAYLLNNISNLTDAVFEAMNIKKEKLDEAFKLLYDYENDDSLNRFNDFLLYLEKDGVSQDYLDIRHNMQNEYSSLVEYSEKNEYEKEVFEERLKNAYKIIKDLETKLESSKQHSNKIINFFRRYKK